MKIYKIIFFCVLTSVSFSQSKKEHLELFSFRIDSLNESLKKEKEINFEQSKSLSELNLKFVNIENQLLKFNNDLKSIKLVCDSLKIINEELKKQKSSENSPKTEDKKNECSPFKFWNINIGKSTYDEIAEYLKSKKNQGHFTDLSIGTIDNNKSNFNNCKFIRSYTAIAPYMLTHLDGILTYKCYDLTCYFDGNDVCIGIKIRFWQKKDYPNNLFDKQVSDMEKLFVEKAILTQETDIIGDKKKIAKIVKENINVEIIEDVNNNINDLGPTIYISCGR